MGSAKAMEIAEKLYNMGLISYPRTETNSYPSSLETLGLLKEMSKVADFKEQAGRLFRGVGF